MLIRFVDSYHEWSGYTFEQKKEMKESFPNSYEGFYTLKRKEETEIEFIAYDLAKLYTHWWRFSEALNDKEILNREVSYYVCDEDRKNNKTINKTKKTINDLKEEMGTLVLNAGHYRKIGSCHF